MQQKVITNRLDWMDWAKAIAITIVVFGHLRSPLMTWVFSFHMPFFIMLSGFLQKKRSLREEVVKSAKSLLLPYVIYNLFLLVYSLCTGEYQANYPLSMLVGLQWNLSMACRPLWFLLALFWMRVAYAALPQDGRKGSYVLALLCILFVWVYAGEEPMKPEHNYFQIFEAVICFPFFIIGTLLQQYKGEKALDGFPVPLRFLLIAVGLVVGFYIVGQNGFVNIFRLTPGKVVPLFYISAAFISICLIWLIYQMLKVRNSYIQLVSEGTLLIFAVHQAIFWPLREVLPDGFGGSLAVALVAVFVLSGFAWLARKYCPALIGKMK